MNRPPASALVAQILRTAGTLLRESGRLFRPFGLTAAQFNVLNVLAGAKEGLSQRELSEILVVDRSNITGLIDRMEAVGWVRRGAMTGDRRAHRVRLTPAGRRLWGRVQPVYERTVTRAVQPVGAARARSTIAVLQELESTARLIGTAEPRGALRRD